MPGTGLPEVMRSTMCANEEGYEGSSCEWAGGICFVGECVGSGMILCAPGPGDLAEGEDICNQAL